MIVHCLQAPQKWYLMLHVNESADTVIRGPQRYPSVGPMEVIT